MSFRLGAITTLVASMVAGAPAALAAGGTITGTVKIRGAPNPPSSTSRRAPGRSPRRRRTRTIDQQRMTFIPVPVAGGGGDDGRLRQRRLGQPQRLLARRRGLQPRHLGQGRDALVHVQEGRRLHPAVLDPPRDGGVRRRAAEPVLRGHRQGRQLQDRRRSRRSLRAQGLLEEAEEGRQGQEVPRRRDQGRRDRDRSRSERVMRAPPRQDRSRPWPLAAIVGGLVAVTARSEAPAAPVDAEGGGVGEVPFDHTIHAGKYGIPCLDCHVYADKSPVAGLPSGRKCMGCHKFVAKDKPAVQTLAAARRGRRAAPLAARLRAPRLHLLLAPHARAGEGRLRRVPRRRGGDEDGHAGRSRSPWGAASAATKSATRPATAWAATSERRRMR